MFVFMSDFKACVIEATDGHIGKVKDLYIDDIQWKIRYVNADTSLTFPGKRIILSAFSVKTLDLDKRRLLISLDKEAVKRGPEINDRSVLSLETETKLADYYGWPKYWRESPAWKTDGLSDSFSYNEIAGIKKHHMLHSQAEMEKFRVHASNGRIGQIADAVFDDKTWKIQSFVVKLKYQDEAGFILIAVNEFVSYEWIEGDFYLGETVEELKQRPIYKTMEEMHEYLPNP